MLGRVQRTTCSRSRLFHAQVYASALERKAVSDARWPGWEVVIGIEVHAQIKSRRKLFSEAFTSDLGEPPNTHVSLFDASFPGTLPKLNPKCVDLALRTALAFGSHIEPRSSFDRKHYFYSDLPAGYQITQYYAPVATGGELRLEEQDVLVRIKQIQLEQDTAKSTFDARQQISRIDLNRAGTGLMEIVSEPDMRSPEEAGEYVRTLRAVLRSVGSSDGNMEEGSLRCDVNVSVNRPSEPWGTRCEIKNLNSIRFMMVAIRCEVARQTALLESGQTVPQETRGFDDAQATTYKLRSKEDAPDYRYMPDPNLPPLLISPEYIKNIKLTMPELPPATRGRLLSLGLSPRDADVLMAVDSGREVRFDGEPAHGAIAYFEELIHGGKRDVKIVANWVTHELLGQLTTRKESFSDNPISVAQLGELIDMVQDKVVTGTVGKTLLRHLLSSGAPNTTMPLALAQQLNLTSTNSPDAELVKMCEDAMAALPEAVEAIKGGNVNVMNRIVGKVMQLSRGRADAIKVKEVLTGLLGGQGET